jgi:hypothetical protein
MALDLPSLDREGGTGSRAILLLESRPSGDGARACARLLSTAEPATTALVLVTLVQPAATRLGVRDRIASPPDRTAVVDASVADVTRDDGDGATTVRRVSSPENLTRLGVATTETLAGLDGHRPVFCLDSLSVLLQYVPPRAALRFLTTLRSHLDAAGARAHFHLDPGVHGERTVAALRSALDEVVEAG